MDSMRRKAFVLRRTAERDIGRLGLREEKRIACYRLPLHRIAFEYNAKTKRIKYNGHRVHKYITFVKSDEWADRKFELCSAFQMTTFEKSCAKKKTMTNDSKAIQGLELKSRLKYERRLHSERFPTRKG